MRTLSRPHLNPGHLVAAVVDLKSIVKWSLDLPWTKKIDMLARNLLVEFNLIFCSTSNENSMPRRQNPECMHKEEGRAMMLHSTLIDSCEAWCLFVLSSVDVRRKSSGTM